MIERLKDVLDIPSKEMDDALLAGAYSSQPAIRRVSTSVKLNLEKVREEFRNAESMRSHRTVSEFLEMEASHEPIFMDNSGKMMRCKIGTASINIAASDISQNLPVELGTIKLEENDAGNAEQDDYVQKRDLLVRDVPSARLIGNPNKKTYVASSVERRDGKCIINGSLTDYLSILKSHYALQHELLSVSYELQQKGTLSIKTLKDCLPKRRAFFAQPTAERQKFRGLGIATLVVFNTVNEGYKVMIRKRGRHLAMEPNLVHVIPSCSFQPEVSDVFEWDIEHCVIKEYTEELFGKNLDNPRLETRDYIYRHEEARSLRDALRSGQCELLTSGLVVQLMQLCPVICCVLLIHDPDWFETWKISPNWEFLSKAELLHGGDSNHKIATELHLDNIENEFFPRTAAEIWATWVHEGLAAFWIGVDAARARLGR
jgi:hypothetical protein